MNKAIFLTIFASGALLLTGCSNNAQTGAVIGSLVGAGIGKSTSNHRDKRASIGQDQDARNTAAGGYNTNTATTTPYYNGSSSHTHGNRSHSHSGASENHSHNNGSVASYNNQQTVQREVIYVERPYYPVSSTVLIGGGYNHYPRRHYRNRHYRHNNRYNNRHHNRHNYKRRY